MQCHLGGIHRHCFAEIEVLDSFRDDRCSPIDTCLVAIVNKGAASNIEHVKVDSSEFNEFELSDAFLRKVVASGIIDSVVSGVEARQNAQLKRVLGTGGRKKRQLFGIDKLEDANWAGTAQGS